MKDVETGRIDEDRLGEKAITAYADRWSAVPGERVRFMVNCEAGEYRADVVKLICGDTNPDGPGYEEEAVGTAVDGTYPGRAQDIHAGSHVEVPDDPHLRLSGSFTLQAMVYPTTPDRGRQGLLTKWSDDGGYGLFVEDGRLAFRLRGDGDASVRLDEPLSGSTWHSVAASFDAGAGTVRIEQEALPGNEHETPNPDDDLRAAVEASVDAGPAENDAPFVMAGYADGDRVAGHFNGKIDRPRVSARALPSEEARALVDDPAASATAADGLVAAWDFAAGLTADGVSDPSAVTDAGPYGLDGEAVQLPARAVPGYNWTGEVHDFAQAPDQYGAIHFHEDDLADAGWDADFAFEIPEGMESAVYAVRLRTGDDEYHVPFFVRPPTGEPTADVAFLAPTASYLAYANESFDIGGGTENHMGGVSLLDERDLFGMAHPEYGPSLYDTHPDRHGSMYSSRLRPLLNVGPKVVGFNTPPSHLHQFNADLLLIDWLEEKGYDYDVLTDEDLHREGVALLDPYRVVLTGHHPEYHSRQQLDAIETYQRNGGRFVYLGGNGFYWVIAYHPTEPGIIETRRSEAATEPWVPEPGELFHAFTGEKGGLWRKRGRPPQKLTGVGFSAQWEPQATYYRRNDDSYEPEVGFVFEGVDGETFGDDGLLGGGAAGAEVDRYDSSLGSPEHAYVLASSEGHTEYERQVTEEHPVTEQYRDARMNPLARADVVYYRTANGGAVFSTGSMSWIGSLACDGYESDVSRITANVLDRFASDEPLP